MTDTAALPAREDTAPVEVRVEREPPLYLTDRELHRRIAPHMGWDAFKAQVVVAEREGFPGVSSRWRGRNWEKVKKWIEKDEGIDGNDAAPDQETEQPPANAAPWRQTRLQNRSKRPPVLDRQPGAPVGNDGLPRQDRRAAG
jgi:hypothetical protein